MARIELCEFFDNNQFTTLESVLVQSYSKECIFNMNSKDDQYKGFMDIIQRCNITTTEISKLFNIHHLESYSTIIEMDDINKIIQKKYLNHGESNKFNNNRSS
jgi:hypothetical protein